MKSNDKTPKPELTLSRETLRHLAVRSSLKTGLDATGGSVYCPGKTHMNTCAPGPTGHCTI